MCGIAGIIKLNSTLDPNDLAWTEQALVQMIHRGPDSMRVVKVDPNVALGSARLRIVDTQCERSDMPLPDISGERFWIVMNGEIYNYQELKRALKNYPFRTESDTEVVMAAYHTWGVDFVKHLEGAFALLIFDKQKRELVIATDSVGEKPLYLREENGKLWFSSTIQSLMAEPTFSKKIDPISIAEFLLKGFVAAPFTYLANIQRVAPGTLMVISLDARKVSRRRYSLPVTGIPDETSSLPLKDALYVAAEQIIPKNQDASVLLSSGIDSRTVLGLAKFLGRKVNAISLAIDSGDLHCGSCESALAEDAAIKSGFNHHKVSLKPTDYLSYWDHFIGALSEPVAAFEGPFLYALIKRAAELGKVVLTGALSDELFDGYGNFNRINANRGHSDFVTRYLKATCSGYGEVSSLFNDIDILDSVRARMEGAMDACSGFLHSSSRRGFSNSSHSEIYDIEADLVRGLDIMGVGSSYELSLLDQISMARSIESRALFAHPRVINAALSLPLPKVFSGLQEQNKYCLRNAMSGLITNCSIPKRAFPIPVSFHQTLTKAGVLKRVITKKSVIADILNLDRSAINHLLSRDDYDAQEFSLRLGVIEKFI